MAPTAGRRLLSGLLLASMAGASCPGSPWGAAATAATRRADEAAVLAALSGAPAALQDALGRAHNRSEALADAARAWALDPGDDTLRDDTRTAWLEAMEAWQVVEVHQLGPTASSLTAAGGQDLRDEVYSWPTINPCRVDQETVREVYGNNSFFDDNVVNVYGLDTLEHLLWAGADNVCPPQVDINTDGTWDDLGADGVRANRAAYAAAVADRVSADIARLTSAWDDFEPALTEASDPYESPNEALNDVYDALFYLELRTKDAKLAEPLGLRDCTADCAELVETRASASGGRWIAANLTGFRTLFASGMGDLLVEKGHADVRDDVLAALDVADAAAAELPPDLESAILDDDPRVLAAHDALVDLADLVKGDVATVLSLQIPSEAAGDAD